MLLTIHAIFALIFIKFAPNIVWAFIIGLISHFVIDAIPHGEEKAKHWSDELKARRLPGIAAIDTLILLIVWYIVQQNLHLPINISFFLILGAVLPDIIQGIYIALAKHPFDNPYSKFHYGAHHLLSKNLLSLKAGVPIQIITFIISVFLLILLYK